MSVNMIKKINNLKKYIKIYEEELNTLKKEVYICIKKNQMNKNNNNDYEYFEKKLNYINSVGSIIEILLSKNLENNNLEWIENIKKQALNFNQIKFLNKYLKLSDKELELEVKIIEKCRKKKN